MDFSHLHYFGNTDTGRTRDHNEDAFVMLPDHGVFCVADGMGGAEGGELASRAAIEAIEQEFSSLNNPGDAARCSSKAEHLQKALNNAGRWIMQYAASKGTKGMGTTAVALLLDAVFPDKALALHAGDSRLYRYRQGTLEQITNDHSLAAATGIDDEDLLDPAFRSVITRAVGVSETVDLETTSVDVEEDDIFLLCSDGLTKMLPDKELLGLFVKNLDAGLPELVRDLINGANTAGGRDNITAVIVKAGKTALFDTASGERDTTDEDDDTSDTSETVHFADSENDETIVPTEAVEPVTLRRETGTHDVLETSSTTVGDEDSLTMDSSEAVIEPEERVSGIRKMVSSALWILLIAGLIIAAVAILSLSIRRTFQRIGVGIQGNAPYEDMEPADDDDSRITELMTFEEEPPISEDNEEYQENEMEFDEDMEQADNNDSQITDLMNIEDESN